MTAQVKCSYADLYIEDNLTDVFLKTSHKFKELRYIGTLSGKYKTYKGRDYLQLATVNGLKEKNYFWVKKVAINILEDNTPTKKNDNSIKNLLLGLALILLGD